MECVTFNSMMHDIFESGASTGRPSYRLRKLVQLTLSTRTTQSSQANARDPNTHRNFAVRHSSNLHAPFQRISMT
uniref:Uncharacterized protein n=1 Tax=Lotus japonicus TaxID=34305 RepID=I3SGV2_LOTJA|nr:unknown [Lotus japonicus]